jgi:hypothetical protein
MYAAVIVLRAALPFMPFLFFLTDAPLYPVVSMALNTAHTGIVLAWVFLAWSGIPETHRGTLSPWTAVASLFLPLYNAYFAVAMNVALCDTLNGILESARSPRRAPRTLGIVASVTWLANGAAGYVLRWLPAGPVVTRWVLIATWGPITGALWFAYMLLCDRARDAVAQLGTDPRALGPPRLAWIQRTRVPRLVVAIAVTLAAVFLVLTVWGVFMVAQLRPH